MSKYVTDFVPKDAFPYEINGDPFKSEFSPSGLVPAPCTHGLPELPPDHVRVSRFPRLSPAGGERPPWGGNSWIRSKYVSVIAFGGRTEHLPGGQEVTVPMAMVKCPVCIGLPAPADLTTPRG